MSEIAAAGLSAGVNLIGSLLGVDSQSKANELNAQLYRENLAMQQRENQANRDFSERMWNMNNAYNTPFMQKMRLEQAGLNPYLTNGEQVGATPSSPASSPSTQSLPAAPMMQPLPYGALSGSLAPLLQAVQVDSGAQQSRANAISAIVQSSVDIYKTYGKDAGDAFLNRYLPLIAGGDFEGSDTHRMIQSEVQRNMAAARLQNIQASLEEQYGVQRYQDMHTTVEKEWNESIARIQAYKRELDQKDLALDQKERELRLYAKSVAGQYLLAVANAGKLDAETDTINQLRPWLVTKAEMESYSSSFDAAEDASIFRSRESLRGVRDSSWYKTLVAVKEGSKEIGAADLARLILDGLETVHPAKALTKRAVTTYGPASKTEVTTYE